MTAERSVDNRIEDQREDRLIGIAEFSGKLGLKAQTYEAQRLAVSRFLKKHENCPTMLIAGKLKFYWPDVLQYLRKVSYGSVGP